MRIVKKIKEIFPQSMHVSDIIPAIKGVFQYFNYAKRQELVIVTHDEDFYELQSLLGFPPKII